MELRALVIPICSLKEQIRVMQEVESRFSVADHILLDIQTRLARITSLRQSILVQAFQGDLIGDEVRAA